VRYQVLATDYDGTLAHHGRVDDSTLAALKRLLATGRRLVMVTGRELPELQAAFPHLELFEWVVAENGALLHRPSTKEEKLLGDAPPEAFVASLRARGVAPISAGRVIVATWEPHQQSLLETIREFGLERQVIFNKGAVMVLPSGVNKATGLSAVLHEMKLSPHNVIGVGDAENDHAFLQLCELSAAVANALPAVKDTADLVMAADHGAGVAAVIDKLVEDDLASVNGRLTRRRLKFAVADGEEVTLPPHGPTILICGPSASGKSTLVTRIVESLAEEKYQFCLVDPEGDYEAFADAVVLGGQEAAPIEGEVLQLLTAPESNAIVNLTGMAIPDRPPYFLKLLGPQLHMRTTMGRPHWLLLDEAHHLLPAGWQSPEGMLPEQFQNIVLITVHPELLSPDLLGRIDILMVVGENGGEMINRFCQAAGVAPPVFEAPALEPGELLLWRVKDEAPPQKVSAHPCKTERRRHRRKYIEGELPPDRSFWFHGPDGKLNLRAQNLALFLQIADGVDDATWEYHRRRGDYSSWFRQCIKDEELAAAGEQVERLDDATPAESRTLMRAAVEREYAALAPGPLPVPGAS
jgi:HAD superfamily hydrolase (TIGR01484 family)